MPALEVLLGAGAETVLTRLAQDRGAELGRSVARRQVRYRPGRSLIAEFTLELVGPSGPSREILSVASGLSAFDDVASATLDGIDYQWWWFPTDPSLPGLAPVMDEGARRSLLAQVGVPETDSRIRTRAYRATRRAVVEVTAGRHRLFLKILPPAKAATVHDRHRSLASNPLVPTSHGIARDLGVVVLEDMPGDSLRLAARDQRWDRASALDDLLEAVQRLPAHGLAPVESPTRRLERFRPLFAVIAPEALALVDRVQGALTEAEHACALVVHGDFHTGQVLVEPETGAISGLIDLDTLGLGDHLTDRVSMLAQLAVLADQDARYGGLLDSLGRHWSREADPEQLALRTAAQIVALATGPFRAQEADWPANTARRLRLADRMRTWRPAG